MKKIYTNFKTLVLCFLVLISANVSAQVINEGFEESLWPITATAAQANQTLNLNTGIINTGNWIYNSGYVNTGNAATFVKTGSNSFFLAGSSSAFICTPLISAGVSQVTVVVKSATGTAASMVIGVATNTAVTSNTGSISSTGTAAAWSIGSSVYSGLPVSTAGWTTLTFTTNLTAPAYVKLQRVTTGSVYLDDIVISSPFVGPQPPKVKTFSIAGTAGTFVADTIKVNLPYATYTQGVSVVNTSDITATTDSTGVTTDIKKAGLTITSFTVGDMFEYITTKSALSDTVIIKTSATVPAPTMTNPTSKSQSVKGGFAIVNIAFTTTNATGVTLTGTLPSGVTGSYAAGVYTISGTAGTEAVYPAVYNYTVTATPIGGYSGPAVAQSGTITVTDPAAKSILYLTTAATATDDLYNMLIGKYNVTARAALLAASGPFDYSAYDLIVLHESLAGPDAVGPGNELNLIKGVDKPILNTKSFFYQTGRWSLGTAINGDYRAAVTVKQATHPIFSGVTITGDSAVLLTSNVYKNIQPTTIPATAGNYVLATTSHYGNVAIHEMTPAARGVASSKYLMISLLNAQIENLSADGLKLLDNAVTYLLGASTFTPVLAADAKLSTLTIAGEVLSPAFDPNVTTYAIDIPTATYPAIVAQSGNAIVGTITKPASGPGTITIPVTSQDGLTTTTYTITVTVGVNETTSASKVYAVGSSVVVEGQVGQEVAVISLVGNTLYKGVISSSPETLPISLDKGVYIVLVNESSTKVIIK